MRGRRAPRTARGARRDPWPEGDDGESGHESRDRRQPHGASQHVCVDLFEEWHAGERTGEDVSRVKDQRREDEDGAAAYGSRLVRQQRSPHEHHARQRHERRDEEHESPLVADVVDEELERADRHPQEQQPLRIAGAAPAGHDAPCAADSETEHAPHAAEGVVQDWEPRHAPDHRRQVVRRLPCHRDLPVVEPVVAPVR